jgi:two-component system KDP operon response regulator KdpE
MTVGTHLAQIVDDDPAVQRVLTMLLEDNGFSVVISENCMRGELQARSRPPDVMIVYLGLPDRDGTSLIRAIRTWSPVPIVVLSSRTADENRLAAFEAGADDYILKPYSGVELIARIRASLRRHARGPLPTGVLELKDLSIDLVRRIVRQHDGSELRLTQLEFRILETLARERDRVVTQARIMTEVWGPSRQDPRVLREFIASLRRKLEKVPSRPSSLITVPGVGYRLSVEAEPPYHLSPSESDQ